ncbi:serine/threonine protein kinase [Kickxella alabastrina]|uniref:Serine/threonine protein kinase n=1 Tax=Kickxella alabastrina TaxID=61397 RepID=A0ACC1IVU1_9FUNG|nr:serine/threonine protein kinase [Kickxella alabastrina]
MIMHNANEQQQQLSGNRDLDCLGQMFDHQLLVTEVPESVWGVLLSLSPADYKTVHLQRTKSSSGSDLEKFGYQIGRHKRCDVQINNPHISNHHCLIYRVESENAVYIEDTSTNGTFLNKERMERNIPVRLHDGDEIQLVRYQESKGMSYFCDSFYKFQNLAVHRNESRVFTQSYLLDRRLGKGAFASVYLVRNRVTGARYAAKIIDRRAIVHAEKLEKLDLTFQKEASILSRVKHPSIVQIHGAFREHDNMYLLLDLADGGELFDEVVNRGCLSEDDTRRILLQLLLAVRYLNHRDIVHRDIKLENILLTDAHSMRVKLADFGLAKIVGDDTFMRTVCGTPMYVAPEVLTVNRTGRYDRQVDMWSLGVVIFICLSGRPPFSDQDSTISMREQILSGNAVYDEKDWCTVSPGARDLVSRMIKVNPRERITVERALEDEWLGAKCSGAGVWTIEDVDFTVEDPWTVEDSQMTESVTAECSQQQQQQQQQHQLSQPWSPTGLRVFPRYMHSPATLLPSSSPVSARGSPVSARGSPVFARGSPVSARGSPASARGSLASANGSRGSHGFAGCLASSSPRGQVYSPGVQTAAIGGNFNFSNSPRANANAGQKRKEPSFMRSQSDLGHLAIPKRSIYFNQKPQPLQVQQPQPQMPLHKRWVEKDLLARPRAEPKRDSGPLVMFEMSPDVSRHPSPLNNHRSSPVYPKPVNTVARRPLLNFPKPLPRPGAQHTPPVQSRLSSPTPPPVFRMMDAFNNVTNRVQLVQNSGTSEDVSMDGQSIVMRKPMSPLFGFGNKRR